jgi:hypothetical protein
MIIRNGATSTWKFNEINEYSQQKIKENKRSTR